MIARWCLRTLAIVIASVLLAMHAPATADQLTLTLDSDSVVVTRGQTVSLRITVTNSESHDVFLTGVETSLSDTLGGDHAADTLFSSLPEFLGPGQTWSGVALRITARPDAMVGTVTHGLALFGGPEPLDQGLLARGVFRVAVSQPACPGYLTSEPPDISVRTGQVATFEASHPSPGATWRWYHNGMALSDDDYVSGTATSKLTVKAAVASDSGAYQIAVTTPCGNFNSRVARLAISPSCTAPPAYLGGWWPFDSVYAAVQPDLSHRASGRSAITLAGGAAIGAGRVGGGLRCLSSNATASAAAGTSPDLDIGRASFSVLAWVKPSSTPTPAIGRNIVARRSLVGSVSNGLAFFLDGTRLGLVQGDGVTQNVVYSTSTLDTTGDWHHVAVAVDRVTNTAHFYIDGISAGDAALPNQSVSSSAAPLIVGGATAGGAGPTLSSFFGSLDEVLFVQQAIEPWTLRRIVGAGSDGICRRVVLTPEVMSASRSASRTSVTSAVSSAESASLTVDWSVGDSFSADCPACLPLTYFPAVGTVTATISTLPTFTSQVILPQAGVGTYCFAVGASVVPGAQSFTSSSRILAGQRPIHARSLDASPILVRPQGATARYRVYNDSTSTVTLSYQFAAQAREHTLFPNIVQLAGAPIGSPAAGSMVIAALDSADLSLPVSLQGIHSFVWFDVTLRDIQGDPATAGLASTIVGSQEDSIAGNTVSVEDLQGWERITAGPNPFWKSTAIRFSVASRQMIDADVFDVMGARVRPLLHREMPPGRHALLWDGRDRSGRACAPGVYFVRVNRKDATESVKIVLLH